MLRPFLTDLLSHGKEDNILGSGNELINFETHQTIHLASTARIRDVTKYMGAPKSTISFLIQFQRLDQVTLIPKVISCGPGHVPDQNR